MFRSVSFPEDACPRRAPSPVGEQGGPPWGEEVEVGPLCVLVTG